MRRWFALLMLVALVVTTACGDDDDDDGGDTGSGTTGVTATAGGSAGGATAATGGGGTGGGGGDAAAGQQIYQANCATCHSVDGSVLVGPSWQGLYGSEIELEGGETVTADDAYITESIRQPGAKIHTGFPNVMPPFANFSDEQINNVIAYIKTLE